MHKNEILTLYDYNYWANERIFAALAKVSHEQFVAPAGHSWGGLRGTLAHVFNGEWIWRMRCQHRVYPQAFIPEEDFANFATLRERWVSEEANMREYLNGITSDQLNRALSYEGFANKSYQNPLWLILTHVVNHGTQHRSECATMLTQLGHSPGSLDLITWLRETGM
jgi:uncharacterized damage-inducible protein DinB